ncbi:MAG: hypothetical protein KDA83_16895 [Planctomycetales bacterium]|nr:hypothetical protein [Planctomycetales bacterium]
MDSHEPKTQPEPTTEATLGGPSPQLPQDDLVAYLDGELTPDEAARIEVRLAEDDELRHRLAQLQRAWDLLGTLPSNRLDETFTQSTVELVALKANAELDASRRGRLNYRRLGLAVAGVLVLTSIAVGYQVSRYSQEAPNRQLMDDLPVIERVDLYRNAQDIEFLVRLSEEGLFDETTIDDQP